MPELSKLANGKKSMGYPIDLPWNGKNGDCIVYNAENKPVRLLDPHGNLKAVWDSTKGVCGDWNFNVGGRK